MCLEWGVECIEPYKRVCYREWPEDHHCEGVKQLVVEHPERPKAFTLRQVGSAVPSEHIRVPVVFVDAVVWQEASIIFWHNELRWRH